MENEDKFYDMKNEFKEYKELNIPPFPLLPPITDDMSDDYIVDTYSIMLESESFSHINWMLRNWHRLYLSNMAKLIKMQVNGTEVCSHGEPKAEIVRRILEFNRRYISHSQNLKNEIKNYYGNLLDDKTFKYYFDSEKDGDEK